MKPLLTLLLLLAAIHPLPASTLKDLFKSMPDSLCLISMNGRLDCLDYLSSGMKAKAKNLFGETSTLVTLTDNYALLHLTQSSQLELKLITEGQDSLILAVHTYLIPMKESYLEYYNTHWAPVKAKGPAFRKPTARDFIKPSTKDEAKAHLSRLGTECIEMHLSPSAPTLTCHLNSYDGDTSLQKELSPHFLDQIEYTWHNGTFTQSAK